VLEQVFWAIRPVRRPRGRPRKRAAKLHADNADDLPRSRSLTRRRIAHTDVDASERLGRYYGVVERTLAWSIAIADRRFRMNDGRTYVWPSFRLTVRSSASTTSETSAEGHSYELRIVSEHEADPEVIPRPVPIGHKVKRGSASLVLIRGRCVVVDEPGEPSVHCADRLIYPYQRVHAGMHVDDPPGPDTLPQQLRAPQQDGQEYPQVDREHICLVRV
jgi:hypothetical protein